MLALTKTLLEDKMDRNSILNFNTTYHEHPDYHDRHKCQEILNFKVLKEHMTFKSYENTELSDFFAECPLLNRKCTDSLFIKYNLIKKRLKKIQSLLMAHDDARLVRLGTSYVGELNDIKRLIADCNIRLTYIAASRLYMVASEHFSLAYETLCKSVDRFDTKYGFAFSTYATQSIYKNMVKERFQDKNYEFDNRMSSIIHEMPDERYDPKLDVDRREDCNTVLTHLHKLSTKEKAVIIGFFGLEGEKMTLQQLSKQLKCSKEYVRQIREKAIGKLQSSIGLEKIANI